jgi:hypothetical protein
LDADGATVPKGRKHCEAKLPTVGSQRLSCGSFECVPLLMLLLVQPLPSAGMNRIRFDGCISVRADSQADAPSVSRNGIRSGYPPWDRGRNRNSPQRAWPDRHAHDDHAF